MNSNTENNNTGRGILLFSNRKYLFALGTFLINLQKYISYDGVIVYHDDFTADEQEAILKVDPKVRFIKYGLENFSNEFGLDKDKLKDNFFINRYTVLSVIKFKIFQHLDEFSTLMLFDLDMVLQDGLEELLEKNFDIAWRNDWQSIRDKLNNWGFNDESINELGMYDVYSKTMTPNGGFVVVKRTFDYRKTYEECVRYLREYSFLHPYSIDEIMFGYITEKMKLNVHYVDAGIYNVFPVGISAKSKLIHFLGDYKPWNKRTVQSVFIDWKRNYDRYVELTGMPSEDVNDFSNISECILQDYYLEKWRNLFQQYDFVYPQDLKFEPDLSGPRLTFSYHGFISYNIETNWLMPGGFCSVWIDKCNGNISTGSIQIKLHELSKKYEGVISYWEDEKGFGVKTTEKLIHDLPEDFYWLYDITAELRKVPITQYSQVSTFHGTRIYLDTDKHCLVHAKEDNGAEIYASINGDKVALFISLMGMNIYVKGIDEDGLVSMTNQQVFFPCWHNKDHSISIEMKNGCMMSAGGDGKILLRHWNREWERFFLKTVCSIAE